MRVPKQEIVESAEWQKSRGRERDIAPAVQEIIQALEEEIVLGVLHPRERLVEDDLMGRFDVKRHVVRKALAELEVQGLVQHKRNSGAQVRALTGKEVVELYALREILEISSLKLIALPVTGSDLDKIIALQKDHTSAVRNADPRAVFRANVAFHAALHALAGNDALIEAINEYARRSYLVRLSTLMSVESLERARADHDEIIDTLRTGDRERLLELYANHLHPARDTYLDNLKRTGQADE